MNDFGLRDLCEWLETDIFFSQPENFSECFETIDILEKLRFSHICTDTRSLKSGQVFLAFTGEKFDGHDFLSRAIELGAGLLIVQSGHKQTRQLLLNDNRVFSIDQKKVEKLPGLIPVIEVENTLTAFQKIARGYRMSLKGKVIAITGSVGKTSTREMVKSCLEGSLKVHSTLENLNNEIGLPATILKASPDDEVVILEMGMRGSGEIELLSMIALPDIAMITNIGWSHVERLGSRNAILKAKCEILSGLSPDGWLVLNNDDSLLSNWYKSEVPVHNLFLVSVEAKPADGFEGPVLWADQIVILENRTRFTLHSRTESWQVILPVPGRHHVRNALFGFAAAMLVGVSIESAIQGAERYVNTGGRQKIIECDDIRLIDDSYNAAPESMLAAIDTLTLIAGQKRKIGVLGCMLELGDYAHELHFEIGKAAASKGFHKLFLIGEYAESIKAGALSENPTMEVEIFNDQPELGKALKAFIRAGDNILIKGSRAFRLEKIAEWLTKLKEYAES